MTKRHSLKAAALAALFALSGCAVPGPSIPVPATVGSGSVDDVASYAKQFLDAINAQSYTESREYCGYFVLVDDETVVATPPRAGNADSCAYGYAPARTIASYHTHGGYLPNYFNEIPSVSDAQSALQIGLDDYLSTPGGRFWVIDGDSGTSTMLCGQGCLDTDPIFEATASDPDRPVYTVGALKKFQSGAR